MDNATNALHYDNNVIIDALPYYDQGYEDNGAKEYALRLVQEEANRNTKNTNFYFNKLPALPHSFETPLLQNEIGKLSKQLPIDSISMARYDLPEPLDEQKIDVKAWVECVDNSHSQLEHQSLRIVNIELLLKYGSNSWKKHTEELESIVAQQEAKLQQLRQNIHEINWQRKQQQIASGQQLSRLSNEWDYLIRENYNVEYACLPLEIEVHSLKKRVVNFN